MFSDDFDSIVEEFIINKEGKNIIGFLTFSHTFKLYLNPDYLRNFQLTILVLINLLRY